VSRRFVFSSTGLAFVGCLLAVRNFFGAPGEHSPSIRFIDIAQKAGIDVSVINGGAETKKYVFESTGSGIGLIDYDNDGYLDIFLVSGSRLEGFERNAAPTNHLFHNNRNGTFTDVSAQAGVATSGWGKGVCAGDFDNDGFDDLFVTYYGRQNILWHNNGDGTFRDATAKAALNAQQRNWSTGCAFVDYDRDGKLDLFVASYVDFNQATAGLPGSGPNCVWRNVPVFCGPRGLPAANSHLYRNAGSGKFTDVSDTARIADASKCYGLGVLTGDFENRGWPDIYVACDSTPSLFLRNNGDGTFAERGVQAGIAYDEDGREQAGMGVSAADYDGDGWLDIFKTNFEDDVPDLYHNEADGSFSFRTFDAKLGFNLKYLGWGGGFLDYDNDGRPDIFIANGHVYPELESHNHPESPYRQRDLLYHNAGKGRFEDVTSIAGSGLELRRSGRGVAFGDFENDGRVDILINNQNDPPTLLHNESDQSYHWISIRTVGMKSNRDGIGARVALVAGGLHQIQEVRSGGSYLSQNDLQVHFGLGTATKIDRIEVRWPSGAIDKMENLAVDRLLTVEEGRGKVDAALPPKRGTSMRSAHLAAQMRRSPARSADR
jgi:enediyne biosynthesis protein E4